MPILSRDVRKTVEREFTQLKRQVSIELFTQEMECSSCREERQLMEELAEMTSRITVNVSDFLANGSLVRKYEVERVPVAVVVSKQETAVRFYGIPSGYEFQALMETVKAASSERPPVSEEFSAFLQTLSRQVTVQVFVAPTCPYCPAMALLAAKAGLACRHVKADIVNIHEFPHLAVKHQVSGVPMSVINGSVVVAGAVSERAFMDKMKEAVGN